MARYFLEFSKKGNIKYISHLDMQRLFKRAFKSAGIPIEYSQGYNPHPKMGFAQPLSLGYTAVQEYLEFNTKENLDLSHSILAMRDAMPQGIYISRIEPLDISAKSLASQVTAARYSVVLPIQYRFRKDDMEELVKDYLGQSQIIAKKKEKKSKKLVDKDIKNQIHWIKVEKTSIDQGFTDEFIKLVMELDGGSNSNLSPEQVISSFTQFSKLYLPREELEVQREKIIFSGFEI